MAWVILIALCHICSAVYEFYIALTKRYSYQFRVTFCFSAFRYKFFSACSALWVSFNFHNSERISSSISVFNKSISFSDNAKVDGTGCRLRPTNGESYSQNSVQSKTKFRCF